MDEVAALKADLAEADATIARLIAGLQHANAERDKYRDFALKLDGELAAMRTARAGIVKGPPSDIAPSFSLQAHADVGLRIGR